ncbi:2-(5''-triphosphoribosyl)-3'-dephosphocoenzyme-A synthase [compost metagenome]
MLWRNKEECGRYLANHAVAALINEAKLTPKPGLVDLKTSGSHTDMDVHLMIKSARSLHVFFEEMGRVSYRKRPCQQLREQLSCIGREAEQAMLHATGGVNTHRGAIWALGLLIAGAAICENTHSPAEIAAAAGCIARFPDRYIPQRSSNGEIVRQKYGVSGARAEAMNSFPHVVRIGIPALQFYRQQGNPEQHVRLNTLLAIMASLDDTCLLHRGGMETLVAVKKAASQILDSGGTYSVDGWKRLGQLSIELENRNASPGGSADLLAAVLFLDALSPYSLQSIDAQGDEHDATIDVLI